MVSRYRKGKAAEREVKKHLQELGYEVYQPPWNKYGQKDIFGVYDLMAVPTAEARDFLGSSKIPTIAFIQVKSNKSGIAGAEKKIKSFLKKSPAAGGFFNSIVLVEKKRWLVMAWDKEKEDFDSWEYHKSMLSLGWDKEEEKEEESN